MQFVSPQTKDALFLHKEEWADCRRCPLGECSQNIVLWRGYIPCDILFIGEAPGQMEDLYGYPFVGRAGALLDAIIQQVKNHINVYEHKPVPSSGQPFLECITNILACRPPDNRDPTKEEAEACRPRLDELIKLAQPQYIVAVGNVATKYGVGIDFSAEIMHPVFILREKDRDPNTYVPLMRKVVSTLVEMLT